MVFPSDSPSDESHTSEGAGTLDALANLINDLIKRRPPNDPDSPIDAAELEVLSQWLAGPFAPRRVLAAHQLNALSQTLAFFISHLRNQCSSTAEEVRKIAAELKRLRNEFEDAKPSEVLDTESQRRWWYRLVGEAFYRAVLLLPWLLFGVAVASLVSNHTQPVWGTWSIWAWGSSGAVASCALVPLIRLLLVPPGERRSRWKLLRRSAKLYLKLRGRRERIDLSSGGWSWATSWLGRWLGLSWVEFGDERICSPFLADSPFMPKELRERRTTDFARTANEVGCMAALVLTAGITAAWLRVGNQDQDMNQRFLGLILTGLFLCGFVAGLIWLCSPKDK
jgi:hypothetical protein